MTVHKVLLVDDSEDARDLLSGVLLRRGYAVDTAVDGADALQKIRLSPPDIVLTDISMPVMDGWSFLEEKWADASVSGIPVIVISGETLARKTPFPYEMMGKPVDLPVLWRTMERLLGGNPVVAGVTPLDGP